VEVAQVAERVGAGEFDEAEPGDADRDDYYRY
jgi:hypothetical protein